MIQLVIRTDAAPGKLNDLVLNCKKERNYVLPFDKLRANGIKPVYYYAYLRN